MILLSAAFLVEPHKRLGIEKEVSKETATEVHTVWKHQASMCSVSTATRDTSVTA